METNESYHVKPTRKYHNVATFSYPKNHAKKYIVKGKPYISMYKATMKAR